MTRIERARREQAECGERARNPDYCDLRGARPGCADWIAEEADAWFSEFSVRDPEGAPALLATVRDYDVALLQRVVEDGPAQ